MPVPSNPQTQQNPEHGQDAPQGGADDRAQGQEGQDPQNEPTEPQGAVEEARAGVEQAQQPEEGDELARTRREAAGRRRQVRELEQENAQLRDRLDGYDRQHVERQAADRFTQAADIWLATSIDAMRGEDGALDDELVSAELGRVAQEYAHWLKASPSLHQGARAPAVERQVPSFGAALRNARR